MHAWAKSRVGLQQRFSPSLELSARRPARDRRRRGRSSMAATKHPTIEGPKLYKRDGWYWIFAPAGGVSAGLAGRRSARDRSTVPTRTGSSSRRDGRAVNGPHQGAWVARPGRVGLVHALPGPGRLRPRRAPAADALEGRLAGDGRRSRRRRDRRAGGRRTRRPCPGRRGRVPQTSDEFDGPVARAAVAVAVEPRPVVVVVRRRRAPAAGRAAPRPPATPCGPPATCSCRSCRRRRSWPRRLVRPGSLREGEEAGLVVMGRDYAALTVSPRAAASASRCAFCPKADASGTETEAAARAVGAGPVELRVEVGEGAICRFSARAGAGPRSSRSGIRSPPARGCGSARRSGSSRARPTARPRPARPPSTGSGWVPRPR